MMHQSHMKHSDNDPRQVYVVKIGGNIIDDDEKLALFLKEFAGLKGKKILVHGGGKMATRLAEQMNVPQTLIEGRRITDAETLRIVTMVYAGFINKNIVARLQSLHCNALGMSGADGGAVLAEKRAKGTIDYGFAGDVKEVNARLLSKLIDLGLTIVLAPITHNGSGQLLNTNADTIAQEIAKTLGKEYDVTLIYSFEKTGVLQNAEDERTVIPVLDPDMYSNFKSSGVIFAGMIPKLDNAFMALKNGVHKVIIGQAENLPALVNGSAGTTIIL